MAQKWRARSDRQVASPKPLDPAALEALAIAYVGRYATSRAKLVAYLARKLRERGWEGDMSAPVDAIADRMVALRYVDDAAYADMKAGAMQRRGLGRRRIAQTLRQDGIAADVAARAGPDEAAQWEAACRFARRKRIGPFASAPADRQAREKQLAAFLRAGHDPALARRWIDAPPGQMPDPDE